MAEANTDYIPTTLMSLADIYRYVFSSGRTPEDAKSQILEEMRAGRLPNLVDRTILYFPRPENAPATQLPPMQVSENKPMPTEVLTIGVDGRGSLHIDWRHSRATRRAGRDGERSWLRIEFEGIQGSREHVYALWPAKSPDPQMPAPPIVESKPGEVKDVAPEQTVDPYYTGAPGRPSAAHLVKAEAKRRIETGEVKPRRRGMAQFVEHLATWLRQAHPSAPPLTSKSIENTIRSIWRASLSEK